MLKVLQKALKIFFGILFLTVLGLMVFYFTYNEKLPVPLGSNTGDVVSVEMQKTMGLKAWNKTRYISWTIDDQRHYIWDKKEELVKVFWIDGEAIINLKNNKAIITANGNIIDNPDKKEKLLYLAKAHFNADKFWFSAPFEVFEINVERSIVPLEGHSKPGLCIQYTSKHNTRAEQSYIFILDENNRPLFWKIWNDAFYIEGLSTECLNWQKTPMGFWYPKTHKSDFFGYEIDIQNMLTGRHLKDLGLTSDPFKPLRK